MNDRIIIDDSKYITEIVNSWFIVYENSGFVAPHLHGNCSWSCVYYVQLGDSTGIGNGSTYLQKKSFNRLKHDVGSTYLQFELQHFLPEEGKLIVWPSHIVHGS